MFIIGDVRDKLAPTVIPCIVLKVIIGTYRSAPIIFTAKIALASVYNDR